MTDSLLFIAMARILIVSRGSGHRSPESENSKLAKTVSIFIVVLQNLHFDYAIFCPAVARTQSAQDKKSDMTNFNQDFSTQISRCEQNNHVWTTTCNPITVSCTKYT